MIIYKHISSRPCTCIHMCVYMLSKNILQLGTENNLFSLYKQVNYFYGILLYSMLKN